MPEPNVCKLMQVLFGVIHLYVCIQIASELNFAKKIKIQNEIHKHYSSFFSFNGFC